MKTPLRIAVTGAAGQISYSLLFRIARGDMLGPDQPVILQLLEIPPALNALQGTVMELKDCAFPLLHGLIATADPMVGFRDADYIILVGARPRSKGMERKDLLEANGAIFTEQGRAISEVAAHAKVLVVGNPANTNALILLNNAPNLKPEQVTAMMRLDHNRAIGSLAEKTDTLVQDIEQMIVWGNHSPTMFPDLQKTTIAGKKAWDVLTENNRSWYNDTYIPVVAKRGAAILEARGASSAASAASAAIDHIRDWHHGSQGQWVTMAVLSDGNPYQVPAGLICGMPCICENGTYRIVTGLSTDTPEYKTRFQHFVDELTQERDAIRHLLQNS